MTLDNEALDRLAPAQPWEADWAEVLDRAGEPGDGRSPRLVFPPSRRTRQLVVIGLLTAAILIATPALGVIGAIRDLFEGTPPTPLVQQHFATWNEMQRRTAHPPHWNHLAVDTAKAHGVLALKTSDGPIYLWVAPARDGGECWLLQFVSHKSSPKAPLGPSGCRAAGGTPALIAWWGVTSSPSAWRSDGVNNSHASLGILIGQAFGRASYVVVESSEHARLKAPVVEHFFLATVAMTATIRKITSYDSAEKRIAESTHRDF